MDTTPRTVHWRLSLALGMPLALALLAACGQTGPPGGATATTEAGVAAAPAATPTSASPAVAMDVGHAAGQRAPDFVLTSVEGEPVALESFQGRPVLLYFFTTW